MAKYWVGGTGTWSTAGRWSTQSGKAQFTATRPTGTNATLTVSSVQSGTIASGQLLYDATGTSRGTIGTQLTGTTGGAGTYSMTAASATITTQACYTMASASTTTAPTTGTTEEIIFDANSGVNPIVTISATAYSGLLIIGSFTGAGQAAGITAAGNPTSAINGTLTITGTSTINNYAGLQISPASTINWTHTGTFNFTTTGGNISAPNCNINSLIVIPSGTWTLTGNVGNTSHYSQLSSQTQGTLSITGGILDLSGYIWRANLLNITGTGSKTINWGTSGTGAFNLTYNGIGAINVVNVTSNWSVTSLQGTDPKFILNEASYGYTRTIAFTSSTWITNNSQSSIFPGLVVYNNNPGVTSSGSILYDCTGASKATAYNIYIGSINFANYVSDNLYTNYIFSGYTNSSTRLFIYGDFLIGSSSGSISFGYYTGSQISLMGVYKLLQQNNSSLSSLINLTFGVGSSYTQSGNIKVAAINTQGVNTTPVLTLNNTGKLSVYYTNVVIFRKDVKLIGSIDATDYTIDDQGFNGSSCTSIITRGFSNYAADNANNNSLSRSFNLTIIKVNNANSYLRLNSYYGTCNYSGTITFADPNSVGQNGCFSVQLKDVNLTGSLVAWNLTTIGLSGSITLPVNTAIYIQDVQNYAQNAVVLIDYSANVVNPLIINATSTTGRIIDITSYNINNNTTLNVTGNSSQNIQFSSNLSDVLTGADLYLDTIDLTGFYGNIYTYYTTNETDGGGDSYTGSHYTNIAVKNLLKIPNTVQATQQAYNTIVNIFGIKNYTNTTATIDIPSTFVVGNFTTSSLDVRNIVNGFKIVNFTIAEDYNFTQGTKFTLLGSLTLNNNATANLGNYSSTSAFDFTVNNTATLNLNNATGNINLLNVKGGVVNFNNSNTTINNINQYNSSIVNFNTSTFTVNYLYLYDSSKIDFGTSTSTIANFFTNSTNVVNFNSSTSTITSFNKNGGTINFNNPKLTIVYFTNNGIQQTLNLSESIKVTGNLNNGVNQTINISGPYNIVNITNYGIINCDNTAVITLTGTYTSQYPYDSSLNFKPSAQFTADTFLLNSGTCVVGSAKFKVIGTLTIPESSGGILNLIGSNISVGNFYDYSVVAMDSYYKNSTINITGNYFYAYNSKVNNVVVSSSQAIISCLNINKLSNTTAPATVIFLSNTTVKISNFNLQGTPGNLVTVTNTQEGNVIIVKPDVWNVGANSVTNNPNNQGIYYVYGNNDYLNIDGVVGITPGQTVVASSVGINFASSSLNNASSVSATTTNKIDVTIKGLGNNNISTNYTYTVTVPPGTQATYQATLYVDSESGYDFASAYLGGVSMGSISGSTYTTSTRVLGPGNYTFVLYYTKDPSASIGLDQARLVVDFSIANSSTATVDKYNNPKFLSVF